jgi:hypothetical protein
MSELLKIYFEIENGSPANGNGHGEGDNQDKESNGEENNQNG